MRCPECGGPVKLAGLGTIEAEQMRDAPAPPPRPDPDPPCECGHPLIAHVTVHRGGCIGRPGGSCGPDCRNECGAQGCDCRDFVPDWSDPSPDPARGEDGEAVRAQAGMGEASTAPDLDKRRAWLRNSLKSRAAEARSDASRCRKAYRTEPYRSMAHELADAHDEAAAAFERRLGPSRAPAPADLSALLDALVEEVTDDVRAYGHVAEPEVARPRVEEYVAGLREERDRLAERVHKAEGMANEINILTAEVKSATRDRDEARAEVERLRAALAASTPEGGPA